VSKTKDSKTVVKEVAEKKVTKGKKAKK